MKLAERVWLPWTSALLMAGAAGVLAMAWTAPTDRIAPPVVPEITCVMPAADPVPVAELRAMEPDCPPATRATLHVDASAELMCMAGTFAGEPGFVAVATYRTTEQWDRIGTISADGLRLIEPMFDQPKPTE